MAADSFLSRWSRRKTEAVNEPRSERVSGASTERLDDEAIPPPSAKAPLPGTPATATGSLPVGVPPEDVQHEPAPPTPPTELPPMESLTHESDFRPFLQPGVDPQMKNAALKTLFKDPHYNVMEGLDIYIGDYSQPDPIPLSMLKHLHQSKMLGLFDDEEKAAAEPSDKQAAAEEKVAVKTTAATPPNSRLALEQNDPDETKSPGPGISNENEPQQQPT